MAIEKKVYVGTTDEATYTTLTNATTIYGDWDWKCEKQDDENGDWVEFVQLDDFEDYLTDIGGYACSRYNEREAIRTIRRKVANAARKYGNNVIVIAECSN